MSDPMMDDPEIAAIAKAQRTQKLKYAAVAVALIVVPAYVVLPSGSTIKGALESEGYTDVKVERKGLFKFHWGGNKEGTSCTGNVKKMPGSTSKTAFCMPL